MVRMTWWMHSFREHVMRLLVYSIPETLSPIILTSLRCLNDNIKIRMETSKHSINKLRLSFQNPRTADGIKWNTEGNVSHIWRNRTHQTPSVFHLFFTVHFQKRNNLTPSYKTSMLQSPTLVFITSFLDFIFFVSMRLTFDMLTDPVLSSQKAPAYYLWIVYTGKWISLGTSCNEWLNLHSEK